MGYTLDREPVRLKDFGFARVDVKISRSIIAQGRQTRHKQVKKKRSLSPFFCTSVCLSSQSFPFFLISVHHCLARWLSI